MTIQKAIEVFLEINLGPIPGGHDLAPLPVQGVGAEPGPRRLRGSSGLQACLRLQISGYQAP